MSVVSTSTPAPSSSLLASSEAAIKSGANTVSSAIQSSDSLIKNGEAYVQNAITGVTSFLGNEASSVYKGVSSSFNSLFDDSNNSSATNKTVTGDAIASVNKSGTPKSTIFTTNPMTTSVKSVNFKNQSSLSSSISDLGMTATSLASRFGLAVTDAESSLTSAVKSAMQNSFITGLKSDLGSVVSVGLQARQTLESTITSVEQSVGGAINGGLNDFRSLSGGISDALTGVSTGLDSFYNTDMTSVTDGDGNAIDGVPSSTSYGTLSTLIGGIKSLGCSLDDVASGITPNSAIKSLYGAYLGICSQLSITYLLKQLLNCNHYDYYASTFSKGLFENYASNNASVASTLADKLTQTNQIAPTTTLAKTLVTNKNLTQSDTSYISNIFSKVGMTSTDAFSTGSSVGNDPVYDSSTLSSTPSYIVDALYGSSDLSKLTGGSVVAI